MRRSTTAVAALTLAVTLGACAQPLPVPEPDAVPASAVPVAGPEQAEEVVTRVLEAVAAADEARSLEAAGGRVTGAAERMRTAQYALTNAGVAGHLTTIPPGVQTLVVPSDSTWPRTIMAVSEPPADLRAPLLLAMSQGSARDPYRLASWVRLFPGASMPPTAQPEVGSPPTPAPEALLVPPAEAIARYVDVVVNGDASPHAALFPPDPVRAGLRDLRETFVQGSTAGGTFSEAHTPLEGTTHAVATADGGALVITAFESVVTLTLDEASTNVTDPRIAAFVGGTPTLSGSVQVTQVTTVAFHIPPAGSAEPLRAVGGDTVTVGAAGS